MSKAPGGIPADRLECYDKLVATQPGVERKGAAMPYTSLNGHMFSFLTPAGTLALRLGPEDLAGFVKKYDAPLCEQHGSVLKEYVAVPDTLLRKTQELKKYFALSHAYVGSLKPKPTKKTKSAKRR